MIKLLFALLFLAGVIFLPSFANPCGSPITYRLGEIDARFSLPKSSVLSALADAEAVWEDALGINLFLYAPDGEIVVHLVYDERQRTADHSAKMKDAIERVSESAESIKEKQRMASAKYESARKKHVAEREKHDVRVAAHNRIVESWNARGGATGSHLQALRREEKELAEAAAQLEEDRLAVNAVAERANSLGQRFNELATEVNESVDEVNKTAGQEFKQGRYMRDRSGQRIDIFEFIGTADLVHVLAHELGHALGLGHDTNTGSIMYGLNSTQVVVPTAGDVEAVRKVCRL